MRAIVFILLGTAISAAVLALSPTLGRAYEATPCNGRPFEGLHSNRTFEIDRCYTPTTATTENAVIAYGVAMWNGITGVADRFATTDGDSSCSVSETDRHWEFALVPTTHPLLNDAWGRMISRSYACSSEQRGRLIEADIVVDQSLSHGSLSALSTSLGARETMVHELGHMLGGNHEPDEPSVICAVTETCGKIAEYNVRGVSRSRAESIFPDDVQLAATFHAVEGGAIDVAVSPWHYSNIVGKTTRIYRGTESRTLCRGASTTVRYSNGNLGKNAVPSNATIPMRIAFSTDPRIDKEDPVAASFPFWGNQGFWGSTTRTITVPNLPADHYYVGVIADPLEQHSEQNEHNNATRLGLEITITDC